MKKQNNLSPAFLERVTKHKKRHAQFSTEIFLNWWLEQPADWRERNENIPISFLSQWRHKNFSIKYPPAKKRFPLRIFSLKTNPVYRRMSRKFAPYDKS